MYLAGPFDTGAFGADGIRFEDISGGVHLAQALGDPAQELRLGQKLRDGPFLRRVKLLSRNAAYDYDVQLMGVDNDVDFNNIQIKVRENPALVQSPTNNAKQRLVYIFF